MLRVRQALVVLGALVLIVAMVLLGIWQLDVYHQQGRAASERRATAAPVALKMVAPAGGTVRDGFGRQVSFSGSYDATLQLVVPVVGHPAQLRVLTALRQDDGSVVAVVRGLATGTTLPPPPTGVVSQTGVLLPSEDNGGDPPSTPGQLTAIQLPILAQRWPGPLVGGIVTLSANDATAQGLAPAPVQLPDSGGGLRNGAYALQWWLFAAFALVMAFRIVRDLGRAADRVSGAPATGTHRGDRGVVPPNDRASGAPATGTHRGDRGVVPPNDRVSGAPATGTHRGDRGVVPPTGTALDSDPDEAAADGPPRPNATEASPTAT